MADIYFNQAEYVVNNKESIDVIQEQFFNLFPKMFANTLFQVTNWQILEKGMKLSEYWREKDYSKKLNDDTLEWIKECEEAVSSDSFKEFGETIRRAAENSNKNFIKRQIKMGNLKTKQERFIEAIQKCFKILNEQVCVLVDHESDIEDRRKTDSTYSTYAIWLLRGDKANKPEDWFRTEGTDCSDHSIFCVEGKWHYNWWVDYPATLEEPGGSEEGESKPYTTEIQALEALTKFIFDFRLEEEMYGDFIDQAYEGVGEDDFKSGDCITFDFQAQADLPEEIKQRMANDRKEAIKNKL